MDIMTDIAAMSVNMRAASLQQEVSLSVTKKAMDSQNLALEAMQEMLPPKGQFIDTYG